MRTRPYVHAWVVVALVFLASCASDSEDTTAGEATWSTGPSSGVDVSSPIDALLIAELGVGRLQINGLVQDARYPVVVRCMSNRGLAVKPGELWTSERQSEQVAAMFSTFRTTHAEDALKTLATSTPLAGSDLASPDDSTRLANLDECEHSAEAEVPSPIIEFQAWLDGELASLNSAMATDQRLVDARQAGKKCIEELGYNANNAGDLGIMFLNEVQLVLGDLRARTIDDGQAKDRLTSIAKRESDIGANVDECAATEYQIAYDLRAEMEEGFVQRNGPALSEWIDMIKPLLTQFR